MRISASSPCSGVQRKLQGSTLHYHANISDRTRIPIGLDEGHHQCVQWDKIDKWMKERSIDVFAPGVIVHPVLGNYHEIRPIPRVSHTHQVKHIQMGRETMLESYSMSC